ncbi:ubiquinol-cytochrome c reductase iron-sulfur subunit [Algoriphagus sp. A40]|uniref:ubiquinol-cytochrome c reductase iron-sulfur subunit n=1 Tax=Algoriphagus sp. A40 TaxID=1945863 RepID=UPI0009855E6C|nr:Rieske 2Fe-2S domain-containing protein [Algoriphagus sp. A40]OOG73775.1 hypothetical protein B0E43_13095 [Algoriphagus sp. A40]
MENLIATKSGSLTDSRRKFLEKAGVSVVLGTIGAAFFSSCSPTEGADPNIPNPSGGSSSGIVFSGNTISIDLSIQSRLKTSGNWLLIENARTLVVNVNGSYTALDSVCTHQGCATNWTFSVDRFTCACHGSQFDPSGRVLNGPAMSPLTQYSTQVNGNKLTITR